jgi:hypothetical protein
MFSSSKSILTLALVSAVVSGGLAWWWTRLVGTTFAQCAGGTPPVGIDCNPILPFYLALGFALLAVVLAIAAAVRSFKARSVRRSVA